MTPLRPALISRLYKAICKHKQTDAELLLSQQFANVVAHEHLMETFIAEIRLLGIQLAEYGRLEQSEEHLALALALYDSFAPREHHEGLACARRLSELYLQLGRDNDLSAVLDHAYVIIQRMARSHEGHDLIYKQHVIATALARRHAETASLQMDAHLIQKAVGMDRPTRVLVLEDNPDDADIVQEVLATADPAFVTEWKDELKTALPLLSDGNVDVVILDLTLPDSQSIDTLVRVKKAAPSTPIIVLTGADDKHMAKQAILTGAHDYLVKSEANSSALLNAVIEALNRQQASTCGFDEITMSKAAALIANSPMPMLHLDATFRVKATNGAMTALSHVDWVGMALEQVWPELLEQFLNKSTAEAKMEVHGLSLPLPENGKRTHVDLAMWPIIESPESDGGFIAQISNIHSFSTVSIVDDDQASKNTIAERQIGTNERLRQQLADERKALADERESHESLRIKIRQQSLLAELAHVAQGEGSLEALFERTAEELSTTLNAQAVLLLRYTDARKLKVVSVAGTDASFARGATLLLDEHQQLDLSLKSRRVTICDNADLVKQWFPSKLVGHDPLCGALCQITYGQQELGVIALLLKEEHEINSNDTVFFEALTNILAVAIDRRSVEEHLNRVAEELARSNGDLQQFASAAAHDLQEPLRSVVSYLELLETRLNASGGLDEKSAKYMTTASNAARRMQTLINDLLEYSRITTGAKAVEIVDCNVLANHIKENLTKALAESNAILEIGPLPKVKADRSQLAQLLQNLISNAIKFRSPDRQARVNISAERSGNEWIFAVKDNGIGLEMEYANRIFVVFQRLHTRGKYPGTGIGLALCKRIVERHKGKIWVESEPDKGTTFFFSWPDEVEA
jgi:signal transduction histidine kinase/DNA-binding NarL/FixJ family response regulator